MYVANSTWLVLKLLAPNMPRPAANCAQHRRQNKSKLRFVKKLVIMPKKNMRFLKKLMKLQSCRKKAVFSLFF